MVVRYITMSNVFLFYWRGRLGVRFRDSSLYTSVVRYGARLEFFFFFFFFGCLFFIYHMGRIKESSWALSMPIACPKK
jgi:hypothetical protein